MKTKLALLVLGCVVVAGASCTTPAKPKPKVNATSQTKKPPSPFANYDIAVIRKVQLYWYAAFEQHNLSNETGYVKLHFDLCTDGRINQVQVMSQTARAGLEKYCLDAVRDSGPFDPIPESLALLVTNDSRAVDFTFYYSRPPKKTPPPTKKQ